MAKHYLKEFYWKDYITITIGLTIFSIGMMGFLKPVHIPIGSLTGISLLFDYATDGDIPMQLPFFIINVLFLVFALKFLGLKFLMKTIYGVLFLTASFSLLGYFIKEPIISNEPLLSGVIGGMMCGAGIGMIFSAGGSTGGMDILIAVINKYKSISFGRAMMMFDVVIISLSYFVFHSVNVVVYGLIVMGVMTYTIDFVVNGTKESIQMMIISKHHVTIADAINKEIKRGCTVLDGTGWYSKQPVQVILVMAKRNEGMVITRLAKTIDENAFVTIASVKSVYGENFESVTKKE